MHITIEKLTDKKHPCVKIVFDWYYEWFGKTRKLEYPKDKLFMFVQNSICENALPQLFVAFDGEKPIGTFQIAWTDDVWFRPDLYPWVSNVFVLPEYRGKGVGKLLMQECEKALRKLGIKTAYLRTSHEGLYEKFGWVYFDKHKKWYPSTSGEYTKIYKLEIA